MYPSTSERVNGMSLAEMDTRWSNCDIVGLANLSAKGGWPANIT